MRIDLHNAPPIERQSVTVDGKGSRRMDVFFNKAVAAIPRHWSSALIGIPWADKGRTRAGVDCWGLVVAAFATRSVTLPGYEEHYTDAKERDECAALLRRANEWPWRQVEIEWPWDIVIFRRAGMESHIGVVVEPGQMLHISEGGTSCIESYRTGRWKPRIVGFYRHVEME